MNLFHFLFLPIFSREFVESCGKFSKDHQNPCDDLRCGPGEECVVSEENGILEAKCQCPEECPNYGDSVESSAVCSFHGVDYQSACHLRHHSCESKTNISIKYYGRCDPCHTHICPSGICKLLENRKPSCECADQCDLSFSPVCGNDGKTYANECFMRLAACKERRNIKVWKNQKCEDSFNPCDQKKCNFWSQCKILENDDAICDCTRFCDPIMKPVCANNGQTFENICEMKMKSCILNTTFHVKHEGSCAHSSSCSVENFCKSPEICVTENGIPKCSCPECEENLNEVCGSDGKTYASECKLLQASCLTKSEIRVLYRSVCDVCESKKCDFYSICVARNASHADCVCPNECVLETLDQEVCGTDGITYANECSLRKNACELKKFIIVAFTGKCDDCENVHCKYGEECRAGKCVCSYNCHKNPPIQEQVCGEDGVLYPSTCHLHLASCQKGGVISQSLIENCGSSEKCDCNPIGALDTKCDDRGKCECYGAVAGPTCDHCIPNFWGIHLIPNGVKSCRPCGCSVFGSVRQDCDQNTGKCECRKGAIGIRCDACADGKILTAGGCVSPTEYTTPRDCASARCVHGAKCQLSSSSYPDCMCSDHCPAASDPKIANLTVCGSDTISYPNLCELWKFACKHQIDLVPISFGSCENVDLQILGRLEREEAKSERKQKYNHSTHFSENPLISTNSSVDIYTEKNKGITKMSSILLEINLNQSKNGVILRIKSEDKIDFYVIYKNGKIVLKCSENQLSSEEIIKGGLNLEVKWINSEVILKINEKIYNANFKKCPNSQISKIFFASDGKWKSSRLEMVIHRIMINGREFYGNDLKMSDLIPPIFRTFRVEKFGNFEFPDLKFNVREKMDLEIRFRSYASTGLLLYWFSLLDSSTDFAALALIEGRPYFVFDLGSGVTYLRGEPIELSKWTSIGISRQERNVSMSINNGPLKKTIYRGPNKHFDISQSNRLFVAHVPENQGNSSTLEKLNIPFEGEIQFLSINEFPLNFMEAITDESREKLDIVENGDDICFDRMGSMRCRDNEGLEGIRLVENGVQLVIPNNVFSSDLSSEISNFTFQFRTLKRNGILWYEGGENDFLIIFLENSNLKLAINLGNDPEIRQKKIASNMSVADQLWHSVRFLRKNRTCDLWVDESHIFTVVASSGDGFLNSNGIIYIAPSPTKHPILRTMDLSRPKFEGCVKNVQINGIKVDPRTDSLNNFDFEVCKN